MLTGLSRPRFTIDTNGAHWTAAADDRGFLCRKVPSGASGEGERHSNWPLDSVSSVSAQGRPLSLVPYGLVGLHHPGFQCRPNRRWVARPSQSSVRGATVTDEPASVATTAIPAQVTFAVYGDPADPKTQSGVAKNLGDALDRRPELAVERLDTLPSRSALLLTAARSVRRHPDRWRWAIHLSPRTTRARSRSLLRQLEQMRSAEVVLPLRTIYLPIGLPYTPYIDNTVQLSLEHWPHAAPWRGHQLSAVLAHERAFFGMAAHVFATGRLVAESLISSYQVPRDRVTIVVA